MELGWGTVQIEGDERLGAVVGFVEKQFGSLADSDVISIWRSTTSQSVYKIIVRLQNVYYQIHISSTSTYVCETLFYKKLNYAYTY